MFCRDPAELSGWDSPQQKAVREHVGRRHTHVCLWRRTPNTAESGDASVPAPQLRGRAIYGLYGAWLTRAGHSQERDLENKRVSQRRVCTHETACDYVRVSLHGCERSHVLRDAARLHTQRGTRTVSSAATPEERVPSRTAAPSPAQPAGLRASGTCGNETVAESGPLATALQPGCLISTTPVVF